MTFGQLQTAVYQVCGYPPPVQPPVVSRVKNWINEAHRHCLRLPGLVELRQRSGVPFTSVAGKAIYNFPMSFERIDAVVERTTQRRLRMMSRDLFRSIDPAETSQGTPTHYASEGWQPRFDLPKFGPAATNFYLWAAQPFGPVGPGLDAPIVRIAVIRVGYGAPERIIERELNGTVPVRFDIHDGPFDIISISMSSTSISDVLIYDGNEFAPTTHVIASIPGGLTSASYWCLRLWPTPSGAVTYYVDGQIEIPDLLYDTDIPMLPYSFHDLPAAFARMREYERTGDNRLAVAAAEWERGLGHLRASTNFPDDYKPVAGSATDLGWTNLNGWFPADRSWP